MPGGTRNPPEPDDPVGPSRRRPGPTIDAKATEIASEPVEGAGASEPVSSASGSDTPADARAAVPTAPHAEAQPASEPQAEADVRQGEAPPVEPPVETGGPRGAPGGFPWTHVGAGLAGAGAALVVLGLLWLAGAFRDDTVSLLAPRLATLETQTRDTRADLANRPAPVDPKVVEDLAARVARVETSVAAAPPQPATDPALANRLAAVESAVQSLASSAGGLAQRADEAAAAAAKAADAAQNAERAGPPAVQKSELDALATRIAALERASQAMGRELANQETAQETASAGGRAMRLAVAATALKDAVERGAAFTAELGAIRPLLADPKVLAPVEPFAATGVPAAAVLGRELSALVPAMQAAGAPPSDGGWLDRLQANAQRFVRIRPIDAAPGRDPADVLSRIETRAARGDLTGCLADLATLPAAMRAPAEAWIKRAEARNAAVDASRRIAADALAALGKAAP